MESTLAPVSAMHNPELLAPLLIGTATVALVVLAQSLARRIPWVAKATRMNDVVGFYLGIIGVLYAVALTFVMVAAWENQDHARETADKEAQTLGTIGLLARGLPEPYAERLVDHARAYAQTAVDAEWPALGQGRESLRLDEDGAHISLVVMSYAPSDAHGQMLADHLVTACADLKSARRARRLTAGYQVPGAIWVLMVYGGLVTVALCFLFEVEQRGLHHVKTALLATFIVVSLLVTWDLQGPFQGLSNVSPEAFANLLHNESTLDDSAWVRFKADYVRETATPSAPRTAPATLPRPSTPGG